jgi:hypothetical protein
LRNQNREVEKRYLECRGALFVACCRSCRFFSCEILGAMEIWRKKTSGYFFLVKKVLARVQGERDL